MLFTAADYLGWLGLIFYIPGLLLLFSARKNTSGMDAGCAGMFIGLALWILAGILFFIGKVIA